jgi:anion-transporting  ArsA/GET3 family ATPase
MTSTACTPRLRIVSGKGGVGKTTIAAAVALQQADAGKTVLILEMSGTNRVADLLGVPGPGPVVRQVAERLFLVDMRTEEAIHEYVLLTLRIEALYRAVFENRFVRRLLRMVPALSQLVLLGKTWYHAHEQVAGAPGFDLLLLDAPSTGHALALLRTPAVVEQSIPAGPVREHARKIREMLVDPERTALHLVTTPEEMPVNETIELAAGARDLGIALGPMVINQEVAPLSNSARQQMDSLLVDGDLGPLAQALRRRDEKAHLGQTYLTRLGELRQNAVHLPRLGEIPMDRSRLKELGSILTRGWGIGVRP